MSKYLIQSPHSEAECLQTLDALSSQGHDILEKYHFGCMAGDHTGYAVVEAAGEEDARRFVPSVVRGKARVQEVTKFSPEQIRSFHKAA